MKKGFFLFLTIILTTFILYGCHSGHTTLRNGRRSGYPAGHDMHPGTQHDPNEPSDGGYS